MFIRGLPVVIEPCRRVSVGFCCSRTGLACRDLWPRRKLLRGDGLNESSSGHHVASGFWDILFVSKHVFVIGIAIGDQDRIPDENDISLLQRINQQGDGFRIIVSFGQVSRQLLGAGGRSPFD